MATPKDGSEKKQQAGHTDEAEVIRDDEFDVGQFVRVLSGRKKIVLGVFLAGTIGAVVFSLVLPKVYEASASLMVLPSKLQSVMSPTRISLDLEKTKQGEYVQQRPTMSLSTHKALLHSNTVMQKVLNKLKSEGKVGEDTTVEQLKRRLEASITNETNFLELTARDKNPAVVKAMANTWAEQYVQYSSDIISGEVKGSGDFISEQFKNAREKLTKAEKALHDFQTTEKINLLEIEKDEKKERLDSHSGKVWKFDFELDGKKDQLEEVKGKLEAMSRNGEWFGAFTEKEAKSYTDSNELAPEQKSLRKRVLQAVEDLEQAKRQRDEFINETNIRLLGEIVENMRKDLSASKSLLSKVNQRCEATRANLASGVNIDLLSELKMPLAENLSEMTLWEILSLSGDYNFFETRKDALRSEIRQQQEELKKLENSHLEYSNKLRSLDEAVERANKTYMYYLNRLTSLRGQHHSLQLDIDNIEHELGYSRKMVERLEGEVERLQQKINEKKAERKSLERELEICTATYNQLASKVDEMQIVEAVKLGEVKQVSSAFEPGNPIEPRKKIIVAGAAVVSLLLGVVFAFVPEFGRKDE